MKNKRERVKRARACIMSITKQMRKAQKAKEPCLYMPMTEDILEFFSYIEKVLKLLKCSVECTEDWRGRYILIRWK